VAVYYIGIFLYTGGLFTTWRLGDRIFRNHPGVVPVLLGITLGSLFLVLALPLIDLLRGREQSLAWRKRLEMREGFSRPLVWWQSSRTLIEQINFTLSRGCNKGLGRVLLGWWRDAGFGSQPFSFFIILIGIISIGSFAGYLTNLSAILSGFIVFLLLIGFFSLLYSKARLRRQLFQVQFPGILDRLSDSLQAGFSLPQAIEFVIPSLSEPSSSELSRISAQIQIGFSVEQALAELYQRRPNEDVRLLVEGLTLQRQVGGNMALMMREMAEMIRKRVELGNEVRTMTAQGRLSAIVIALLVPVSLGLLSMFPGYTDVLFSTTIGNLVLITAGILEMIGAMIVIRLIRIEV